ncbi:MAG: serine/threonine protein kinase [Ruminococcaceae bacterium]|nr:serine/threonine protein kinase [Oscillospiraceae bacterium]
MRIENRQNRTYSYDEQVPLYTGENSSVYYAMDETFSRKVCLKIVSFKNAPPSAEGMLKKEAIALSKAGAASNHVPMLLDFWSDRNAKLFYLVMQYIPGDSLRKRMLSADRRMFNNWMISLCDTLQTVHNAHIFHKDIKPENVIITPAGDVYLIDFNISIAKPNLNDGTEFYRAPEMYQTGLSVARGQSDMFSLGVMMYEFYTGTKPVDGVQYGTDIFQADTSVWGYFSEPVSLCPSMPKLLNNIIVKCMNRNPMQRYRQFADIKRELIQVSKELRGWTN